MNDLYEKYMQRMLNVLVHEFGKVQKAHDCIKDLDDAVIVYSLYAEVDNLRLDLFALNAVAAESGIGR